MATDFSGLGLNPQLSAGMSPEYGGQLFKNLQMASRGAQMAGRQQVLDQTGRFGSTGAGAQLQGLQNVNRQTADSQMQAAGGAQIQGAQAGQQNRQFNSGLQFQAQQAALDRQLKQQQLQMQLAQEQNQFGANRGDSMMYNMMNLGSGLGGAAVKYGLGGA